jgi:hypothetical protein
MDLTPEAADQKEAPVGIQVFRLISQSIFYH